MVQFRILSGSRAGTVESVPQLPFLIGRSGSCGLALPEPGVWEQHLKITHEADESFYAQLLPGALATHNGQPFERTPLKNGDILELGSVKLQFWLTETTQHDLRLREGLTWVGLVLLIVLQLFLILRLTR